MFRWLFKKKIERDSALESYLDHFDAGELAFLKSLAIWRLYSHLTEGRLDFPTTDLVMHIHVAAMVKMGRIPNNLPEIAAMRTTYKMQLGRDVARIKNLSFTDFSMAMEKHRLPQPSLTDAQEKRLGSHLSMLERIYAYRREAPLLPELEVLGEGTAWEASWRN